MFRVKRLTLTKIFQVKKIKIILIVLAILLYVGNYQICEYVYPTDIEKWWGLKVNIYAIIIALLFIVQTINTKGLFKLFATIGAGFAISSLIDKVWYNTRDFNYNDVFMIVITVGLALFEYLKNYKNVKSNQ